MQLLKNFLRVQHSDPTLLLQRIDEVIDLGLGLELRDFMLPTLLDSPRDLAIWIRAYRELVHNRISLAIHGPTIDLNLGSLDERIRQVSIERFIQSLSVAKEIHADFLIMHTGYDHRFLQRENWFKSWVSRFLESYVEVNRKTVYPNELRCICVENSPEEPMNAYWTLLRLLQDNSGNIPICACLDYNHLLPEEKPLLKQHLQVPGVVYLHYPLSKLTPETYRNLSRQFQLQSMCLENEVDNIQEKLGWLKYCSIDSLELEARQP